MVGILQDEADPMVSVMKVGSLDHAVHAGSGRTHHAYRVIVVHADAVHMVYFSFPPVG